MAEKRIRLLAVDDDQTVLTMLGEAFTLPEYDFTPSSEGKKALGLLREKEYDVVILDLDMPEMHGLEVLQSIRDQEVPVEVIILTGHATVSVAVEGMKLGAHDFLSKPLRLNELQVAVRNAFEKKQLLRENQLLRVEVDRRSGGGKIITKDSSMEAVLATVTKVAASDFPVLILGETGTGKELLAREVHDRSEGSKGAFVPLNCGALPENMLESELFGFEKGAFTGAAARKPGLLEVADGGTLFLDEIAEMPLALQGKILRVLESGSFYHLGGTRELKVRVRFISATNREIEKEVEKGSFRQDLYYRISALPLHLPPLRQRRGDIPLLVEHILGSTPAFRGRRIGDDALGLLVEYDWPGNVRELQNVVHRLFLLAEGDVVGAGALRGMLPSAKGPSGKRLDDVEREHILRVLGEAGGQRNRAAEILGINPKTLYRKLKEYGEDS